MLAEALEVLSVRETYKFKVVEDRSASTAEIPGCADVDARIYPLVYLTARLLPDSWVSEASYFKKIKSVPASNHLLCQSDNY